jgi:hypothetical protein
VFLEEQNVAIELASRLNLIGHDKLPPFEFSLEGGSLQIISLLHIQIGPYFINSFVEDNCFGEVNSRAKRRYTSLDRMASPAG